MDNTVMKYISTQFSNEPNEMLEYSIMFTQYLKILGLYSDNIPVIKSGYYGIINGEFSFVESINHLKVTVIPRYLHQNLWVEASDDLISWKKCTLLYDKGNTYTYRYQTCVDSQYEPYKYIKKTTQPSRDYVVEDFPYHFEYNIIDIPENINNIHQQI